MNEQQALEKIYNFTQPFEYVAIKYKDKKGNIGRMFKKDGYFYTVVEVGYGTWYSFDMPVRVFHKGRCEMLGVTELVKSVTDRIKHTIVAEEAVVALDDDFYSDLGVPEEAFLNENDTDKFVEIEFPYSTDVRYFGYDRSSGHSVYILNERVNEESMNAIKKYLHYHSENSNKSNLGLLSDYKGYLIIGEKNKNKVLEYFRQFKYEVTIDTGDKIHKVDLWDRYTVTSVFIKDRTGIKSSELSELISKGKVTLIKDNKNVVIKSVFDI